MKYTILKRVTKQDPDYDCNDYKLRPDSAVTITLPNDSEVLLSASKSGDYCHVEVSRHNAGLLQEAEHDEREYLANGSRPGFSAESIQINGRDKSGKLITNMEITHYYDHKEE